MPKKPKRITEAWWFILPQEREAPVAEQGRFLLSPLSQAERMRLMDERSRIHTGGDGSILIAPRNIQQAREIVLEHLVQTENVPSDLPLAWPGPEADLEKREKWLDENLKDLDVVAIGMEIRNKSILGEDLKNSSPA